MFFIEALCAHEVFTLEEPRLLTKDFGTDMCSDGIVCGVSDNGGDREEEDERERIQDPKSGDGTGGKKEGVPGKEWSKDEAGFAEYNDEKDGVCPKTVGHDDALEMNIKVKKDVEELCHERVGRQW